MALIKKIINAAEDLEANSLNLAGKTEPDVSN